MKAVVLLSGGIDSTVILAMALRKQRFCYALSFDYGQRHRHELIAAQRLSDYFHVPHQIINIDPSAFTHSASSLIRGAKAHVDVPKNRKQNEITSNIPSTYVPARNTLFLAYALGQTEQLCANEIYIGSNADDALPYPDCRPAFLTAFQEVIKLSTKQSIEGNPPQLIAPLLSLNKKSIIELGFSLKVPFELTFSCYDPSPSYDHCGQCDACFLRKKGFLDSKINDPTVYNF